jgi:serine/threonine protein phosphatase PrpC
MEDSYAVVPEMICVPAAWVHNLSIDRVCGITLAGKGDSGASEQPLPSTTDTNLSFLSKSLSSREMSTKAEDPMCSALATQGCYAIHLLAVYDGHGGASVSDHCSKKLHEHLKRCLASRMGTQSLAQSSRNRMFSIDEPPIETNSMTGLRLPQSVEEDHISSALTETFLLIDKDLFKKGQAKEKGTTAVVVLVGQNHIWVSNCGAEMPLCNYLM